MRRKWVAVFYLLTLTLTLRQNLGFYLNREVKRVRGFKRRK
jgi:hypothetical protein